MRHKGEGACHTGIRHKGPYEVAVIVTSTTFISVIVITVITVSSPMPYHMAVVTVINHQSSHNAEH